MSVSISDPDARLLARVLQDDIDTMRDGDRREPAPDGVRRLERIVEKLVPRTAAQVVADTQAEARAPAAAAAWPAQDEPAYDEGLRREGETKTDWGGR